MTDKTELIIQEILGMCYRFDVKRRSHYILYEEDIETLAKQLMMNIRRKSNLMKSEWNKELEALKKYIYRNQTAIGDYTMVSTSSLIEEINNLKEKE